SGRLRRGFHDGRKDVRVGCAFAEIAGKGPADIGLGRLRVLLEERRSLHYLSRRAETALQAHVVEKRLLDGARLAVFRKAFDGLDLLALFTDGEEGAGVHRHAVNDDGAGAALRPVTADIGASQPER